MALRKADALIYFGGSVSQALLDAVAIGVGLPVFVIWAGSDVVALQQDRTLAARVRQRNVTHFAVAPWLIDELQQFRINARHTPVAAIRIAQSTPPFPAWFQVAAYLPEPRAAFYGSQTVYRAARSCPDVRFVVTGQHGATDPEAPSNVSFTGQLDDLTDVFNNSVLLLRNTQHDGMSLMVLEAMNLGRYVVWTHEIPGVKAARDEEEILDFIRQLKQRHADGTLGPNEQGIDFVRARFDEADVARGLETALNGHLLIHSPVRNRDSRSVAVSGESYFVSTLCERRKESITGWRHRPLRFGSRFEVLAALVTLLSSDVWYTIGSATVNQSLRLVTRIFGKPHVMHWTSCESNVVRSEIDGFRKNRRPPVQHLAEVEWAAGTLAQSGLEVAVAPLPRALPKKESSPMPDLFTVLLYVPRNGSNDINLRYERIMDSFQSSGVRFLVVGGGTLKPRSSAQVENLGFATVMDDIYAKSSVYLCLSKRAVLPQMILESLSFGRYVIWSRDFPFVIAASGETAITDALLSLNQRHRSGTLPAQHEAANYIVDRFDPRRCLTDIANVWDKALHLTAAAPKA